MASVLQQTADRWNKNSLRPPQLALCQIPTLPREARLSLPVKPGHQFVAAAAAALDPEHLGLLVLMHAQLSHSWQAAMRRV